MQLRKTLKILMQKKGLTIKRLSIETGISESTIKTWLGGSNPRSMRDVLKVAKHLETTLEYLLFEEDSKLDPNNFNSLPLEELFHGWLRVKIERAVTIKKKRDEEKN